MQIWQGTEELNSCPESPGLKAALSYSYGSIQYNFHLSGFLLSHLLPLSCFFLEELCPAKHAVNSLMAIAQQVLRKTLPSS